MFVVSASLSSYESLSSISLAKGLFKNASGFLHLGTNLSRFLEGMEIEVEHQIVVALVCLLFLVILVGANGRFESKDGLARNRQLEMEGHERTIVISSLALAVDFCGCFGECSTLGCM